MIYYIKNEYVKQGFYEDVLKREEISGLRSRRRGCTATRNGESGNKTSSCYHEIVHKELNGRMVVWISSFCWHFNFEDIQSTRAFFSSFYEMTMEKNTTFLIRKAETEEEIMDVIMNSMNETEE